MRSGTMEGMVGEPAGVPARKSVTADAGGKGIGAAAFTLEDEDEDTAFPLNWGNLPISIGGTRRLSILTYNEVL